MKKEPRKKRFLKLPIYPGGNEEFRKFIDENLKYPEEALNNRIEGIVYLSLQVNDQGMVTYAKVDKGLGYGCDEEALRLAKILRYEAVKNRGVRISSRTKIRIRFELKDKSPIINYSYVGVSEEETPDKKSSQKYQYRINLE